MESHWADGDAHFVEIVAIEGLPRHHDNGTIRRLAGPVGKGPWSIVG
jgi:hypothetical protein